MDEPVGASERPPRASDEEPSRRLSLPASAPAAGLARRATYEALRSWGVAHLQETALLLVSELVTNAVQHSRMGSSTIMLRLGLTPAALRIEVIDADPRWPRPRQPAGLDESGFGFVLVAALARSWGLRDTPAGKAVWAELDTRPGPELEV